MPSTRPPKGIFPPLIVIPPPPSHAHTHTVVFLHGRGSNARKFHGPLLSTPLPCPSPSSSSSSTSSTSASSSMTLRSALPSTRFVFPTAPLARATKYRRSVIHQWYDGSGDWEPRVLGELKPSVQYIRGLLVDEIALLGGDAKRLVLAGISQGSAMALTSLLLWEGEQPLGGVVGVCAYMPLVRNMMDELEGDDGEEEEDDGFVFETDEEEEAKTPLCRAVDVLREEAEVEPAGNSDKTPFLSTPVFMAHGTKDEKVQLAHGQRTAELLRRMGVGVEFRVYEGLGHWYSSEMLGHVVEFLKNNMAPDI